MAGEVWDGKKQEWSNHKEHIEHKSRVRESVHADFVFFVLFVVTSFLFSSVLISRARRFVVDAAAVQDAREGIVAFVAGVFVDGFVR
jgi:hypothetical protein